MDKVANHYRFREARHATTARAALRKLATMKPVKSAGLGGDQEGQFEQSFASLSFAYLKDKAPKLLDYMLGFQLVDRNDDNTKAIGIFGFKIGEEFVYAPVFFLNGDLKGHELLYLKKQDQFVPMKENWVNYLLNRQPHMLGEGTSRTTSQLNVRQPNYSRFNFPPGKTASWHSEPLPPALGEYIEQALPMLGAGMNKKASFMAKAAGLDERLNLPKWLGEDVANVQAAMELFRKFPAIKQAAEAFHGPNLLVDALQSLRKQALTQVSDPILGMAPVAKRAYTNVLGIAIEKKSAGPPVTIKFDEDVLTTENNGNLTDDEREKLLRDGVLVTDNREVKSQAYSVQQPLSLQNPSETGLYDVLVKGGKFERCLVIIGPTSDDGNKDFATVVNVDTKGWVNAHPTQIFVREAETKEDYKTWLEKLPKADSFAADGTYLVLTSTGMGSTPFEIRKKQSGDDDAYHAYFNDYASINRANYLPPRGYSGAQYDNDRRPYEEPAIYLNRRTGSKLTVSRGSLYIPVDSYKLTLKDPPQPTEGDHEILGCGCGGMSSSSSSPPPVAPGNLVDLQMEIMQKTARLKIIDNDVEVFINGDKPRSKRAALVSLVVQHGFDVDTARELLKTAKCRNGATFRVKYAEPYPTGMGPGAPSIPDPQFGFDPAYGSYQTQYPQDDYQSVPDMQTDPQAAGLYDPTRQPDPQALQAAQQAAGSGQKEVFDVSMIGSMLKAVRQDSLVDRYLGDLLKALDRFGRILFLFYWHSEEFQDRYGKADMPELEDSLRNAFESVGDVVLYLKQKQIEPYSGAEMGEPEIDETARN